MFKKTFIDFILGGILFAGLWYALLVSTQPVAETILFNGKIITVYPDFSYQQAVVIADGKILALGSDQEMEKLAGPRTCKIDLGGRSVSPGLADNHLHSSGGGPGVDLSSVRTLQELLEAISVRVGQSEPEARVDDPGQWTNRLSASRLCSSANFKGFRLTAAGREEGRPELHSCGFRNGNARWWRCPFAPPGR